MKTALALLLTCLAAAATAAVSTPPPPPASVAEVQAGTVRSKYVSPYTAAQAGLSSPTGGITATVAATIVNGTNANGTITLLRPAGTKTNFIPTADNDDARYTALANARTTAVSGDTILVGPGNYHSGSNSVAKNGVNWHFAPGATLYGSRVWDDGGGTATSFTVSGGGVFQATNVYACVWFTNTASVVTMTGAKILGRYAGVNCGDATLSVTMFEAITSTVYDAIWNASGGYSGAGRLFVTTPRLVGGNNGLELDGGTSYIHADFVQGGTDAAAPALNMLGGTNYLHLSQVACTNSSVATATFSGGDNVLESDRIQGKFSFTGGVLKMHALLDGGPLDVTPLAATADGLTLDNCVLVAGASVSTSLQGHPTTDHNVQVVGGLSYTVGKAPTLHALLTTYGTQTFIGDGSQLTGLSSGTSVAQGTNIVLVTNGSVVTIHGTATGGGSGIPQTPGGTGTNTDLLMPSFRTSLITTNGIIQLWSSDTTSNSAPFSFITTSVTNNWDPGLNSPSYFRNFPDTQLGFGYNLSQAPGHRTNDITWIQNLETHWFNAFHEAELEWYQRMTLPNGVETGGPFSYNVGLTSGLVHVAFTSSDIQFRNAANNPNYGWLFINTDAAGKGNMNFYDGYLTFNQNTNRWNIQADGVGLLSHEGGVARLFGSDKSVLWFNDGNTGEYLRPLVVTSNGPALIWNGTNSPVGRWEFADLTGTRRPLQPFPTAGGNDALLERHYAIPPYLAVPAGTNGYRRLGWLTNHASYYGADVVEVNLMGAFAGHTQKYFIPQTYLSGLNTSWRECLPLYSAAGYTEGDTFAVDVRAVSGAHREFRVRHIGGPNSVNLYGTVIVHGLAPFTIDTSDVGTNAASGLYPETALIQIGGKLGIGTNNPFTTLHVVGNAILTGTENIGTGLTVTTGGITNGTPFWKTGTGSPESAVVAPIGSLFSRTDGSTDTALYRKETGTGNTGWVAVSAGGGGGSGISSNGGSGINNVFTNATLVNPTNTGTMTAETINATTINVTNFNVQNFYPTNTYAENLWATNAYILTNTAPVYPLTNVFVIGTRYTNANQRAFVSQSFQLTAAVAGTAAVTLIVEQGNGITNRAPISAGPLTALVTIEQVSMFASPNARFTFTDATSGSGASVSAVTNSATWIGL